MTGRRTATAPALVVPDEQTWTLLGADPLAEGVHPVFEPGTARRLLVPERLPAPLAEPLSALLAELPAGVKPEERRLSLPGKTSVRALAAARDGDEGGGGEEDTDHSEHGDHAGHHDMMAIVGEPSADGLVMETMELRLGPLGTSLPGGLAVDVTLDGDVVAESKVGALLRGDDPGTQVPAPPDPLSPVAWTVAIARAAETAGVAAAPAARRWVDVAAVELERAISHLAWLRSFGRLLGWAPLVAASSAALAALQQARAAAPSTTAPSAGATAPEPALTPEAIERARAEVQEVVGLAGSRWMRLRTKGQAVVEPAQASAGGLAGPSARACGLSDDARTGDPLYRELGFEPVVRSGGDAFARTLVRTEEARAAVALAVDALRAGRERVTPPSPAPAEAGVVVEGPRGPLHARAASGGWQLAAPGAASAREAAAAAMVGSEWAAALVALGSFDLSPWEVAE